MNIEQIREAAESESPCLSDKSCIKIYVASSGNNSGADRIFGMFEESLDENGIRGVAIRAGSFGYYDLEPIVVIERPDLYSIFHKNVDADSAAGLIENFLLKDEPVKAGAFCFSGSENTIDAARMSDLPLFNLQRRIALRNCGWIDPGNIHHYVVHGGGYTGLARALSMGPKTFSGELFPSLLDRRLRIGDSTADQWQRFADSEGREKCLICNAMDADPKSVTSRLLLESDPHSVLEGMLIAGHATGASRGILYIAEKAGIARRLRTAADQMRRHNLLGPGILHSDFSFEIEIKYAPESFVTGQWVESFRCLEENQPPPRVIPDLTDFDEYRGNAFIITGPEVLSNLSAVLVKDKEETPGSKVMTLGGCAIHKYTVEIPIQTTIRSIIEEIGGGCASGKPAKAVILGGSAGRFIAPNAFDLEARPAGESQAGIGPDSIEILDAGSSVVDIVRDIAACIHAQSCGKCLFCREGSLQTLNILEDISDNRGKPQDLDLLTELGKDMKTACLCAFGRNAPDPVLSSIELFREEYEERIQASPL
jgi:NADH-quinone oxidoreductase subunit F